MRCARPARPIARALPSAVVAAVVAVACAGYGPHMAAADEVSTDALVRDCKKCPSDAELRPAAADDAQFQFVRRVNALETRMTGRALSPGNHVELLLDGPATHGAQLEAIARAKDHVHLITYIMTDQDLAHRYLKALGARARAGVKVRLMFDSVGSRTVGEEYRTALTQAGIEVREYGSMNPAESQGKDWHVSRRHHRKLLIVDGRIAFTGGINISDEYESSSVARGGKASGSGGKPGWRDTSVSIEGPGVAEFQKLFFDSWGDGHEPIPDAARYWPKLANKGRDFVRAVTQEGNDITDIAIEPVASVVRSSGEKPQNAIYASYVAAMTAAQKRIWITQAYFIPNKDFITVLTDAARRGVDVRVLVPSTSDIQMMVDASRFHYQPLLEAKVKVYEYAGPMLHAKTAVIDGVWSTVGSSNLDYRSFIHNDEANAIIIGHDFGAEMEKMFLEDIASATSISRDEWEQRPWMARAKQRLAVLMKYWI
jgi:cardiolipin synthase A/B